MMHFGNIDKANRPLNGSDSQRQRKQP